MNGTSFLVDKPTSAEAVCCAVEKYIESFEDAPDQCVLNLDTMALSVMTCGVTEQVEFCEAEAPPP